MTGAKDPDEYIKLYGADKFRQVISKSQSGFDYKLDTVLSKYNLSLADDKIKASAELCNIIASVYSSVERSVYISTVAERLGLTPDVMKNDVERIRAGLVKKYKAKEGHNAQLSAKNIGDRVNPDSAKNIKASAAEEVILGLMLLYDEHRAAVAKGSVELSRDDFFTEFGKRVFDAIIELEKSEGGYSYALLGENFTPDEMGRMQHMEYKRRQLLSNGRDVLEASIKTLKSSKNKTAGEKEDWMSALAKRKEAIKEMKK